MTSKTLTRNYYINSNKQILESISEPSNTVYYVFAARSVPYTGGDATVPVVSDNDRTISSDVFSNMLHGKQITASDMSLMITRNDWVANTVYDQYSDTSNSLSTSDYFVSVDAGSYYHVFKCLYNANGVASTIRPDFASSIQESSLFDSDDGYYQTSDGYQWKYMYSVSQATFDKFATYTHMPITANGSVSATAIAGSIDVINVDSGGSRYDNWVSGTFNSSQIKVSSNSTAFTGLSQDVLYAISANANSANDYYNTCTIKLTSGTGSGQYRSILDYVNDGTNKIIRLSTPFTPAPDSTTTYEISPTVMVYGNGTQTLNCEARALVNTAASNSIYRIEILERGAGYFTATANVQFSNVVSVSNTATLTSIMSPVGGHGFDAYSELGAVSLGISVDFANTESGYISTGNSFRQVGIIQDPLFANVQLTINKLSGGSSGSDGNFLVNETLSTYKPKKLFGTVSCNTTSAVVIGTTTDFANTFSVSDRVMIVAGSNKLIGSVASVTNSTYMTLTSNCSFANATANIYEVVLGANGIVLSTTSSTVNIANMTPTIKQYDSVIGLSSFATANVTALSINGSSRSSGFPAFNQLVKLTGTVVGTFSNNELLTNLSKTNSTAYYHSGNSTTVYLTGIFGEISNNDVFVGQTSGATFTSAYKYVGDIVPGPGKVLYIQNSSPISRSNTQTETIKIVVEN